MIREVLEIPYGRYDKSQWICRVDGVEAFKGYKNPIHEYVYDNIYYTDVMHILDELPNYDIILLIDVLEHFTKDEGYSLIRSLIKRANKSIIISTPLYPDKQKDYNGNYYEEHKSRWFITDFIEFDYSYKYIPIGNNGAQIFNIFKSDNKNSDKILTQSINLKMSNYDKRNLTIGYFLPHKNLTGGMKMLLENMKSMKKRGHKIYAFLKSGTKEEEVLPSWYSMEVDKEVNVPFEESLGSYINDCDIVIAGWISQLEEVKNCQVPVVYWEQGSEWLFGDYNDLFPNSDVTAGV
ncbi:MAG: hypothetical protein L5655_12040 [Thermosediminibacteraceae bacterium]|nr:hypothetical protein [Thermosediminibacteraceae bacterium]